MRLAAIPPSIKEIGVGQVEGIDVAHQLLAFRSRDGVFLGQMLRNPNSAGLQGIFALLTDQCRLRPIQYEPKSLQFLFQVVFVHQAPRVSALDGSIAGHCATSSACLLFMREIKANVPTIQL